MSTNIYFVKNNSFTLDDIFEKTPIMKHVDDEGNIFLRLENDYLYPEVDDSGIVMGGKKYGRNSVHEILKCLVKEFDLYFIYEYDEFEGYNRGDEYLEEYRQPLIAEINLENQVSNLILKFRNMEALIIYILHNYKKLIK